MTKSIKFIFILLFFSLLSCLQAQTNTSGSTFQDDIKKITIGSEPDYPPFCIVNKNGNADGFAIDLFKSASKAVNLEVKIKIGVWNQIRQDLAEGKIDALPLVGKTPERELLYDFTLPYLTLHGAVFVRKGTVGIKTLDDLKSKAIIVMKGDNAEEYVRRRNISNSIITTNTYKEAFKLLAAGEYDAVITQRVLGIRLLKDLGIDSIVPLNLHLDEFRQDFCFAVKKGNKDLLSRLNEGLSIIIANGTYDDIHTKWFGPDLQTQVSLNDVIKTALYILIPSIILFAIIWIFLLRSTIKKRTSRLKESEENFRAIFEQAAVGVALLNTRTGQFIRINQKYCDFVGYSMPEMLKKTFMDITYIDDIQLNISLNTQLMENNTRESTFEKRYLHKNGNILWGKITISPLWKPGEKPETFYHIAIVEDITKRKQTESIIQEQNKQLLELNTTKDKFFSIIAHDLKSPFQGFLGLTKMMVEDAHAISAEELAVLSRSMNQTAQNLFTLLKNLFDWAQMQRGLTDFHQEEFSLSGLINTNMELINLRSQQKGIKVLNLSVNSGYVFADKNMISSVLLNLLSNAVKFTDRNGTISINTKKSSNDIIEVSISDTGIGIHESLISRLFKIDEKTGREGTDGELSTGLGLLLCKDFVEKNGGNIWVESEEGKGSTFYFTLPSKDNLNN